MTRHNVGPYIQSRRNYGVVQNCYNFQRVHIVHTGRHQWPAYVFLNVDYDALHFHTGSLKINIFKVLFWDGGGHKKDYTVYAFDNVGNYGRALINGLKLDKLINGLLTVLSMLVPMMYSWSSIVCFLLKWARTKLIAESRIVGLARTQSHRQP